MSRWDCRPASWLGLDKVRRLCAAVAVLVLVSAGCATAPGKGDASVPRPPSGAVTVYEDFIGFQRLGCPYVIVSDVSARGGAHDPGTRGRLTELLRQKAYALGGHSVVIRGERTINDELVITGTVVRFTREDCPR